MYSHQTTECNVYFHNIKVYYVGKRKRKKKGNFHVCDSRIGEREPYLRSNCHIVMQKGNITFMLRAIT